MKTTTVVTPALALLFSTATVIAEVQSKNNHVWDLAKFTSLVAFGDSYTDENRLGYFLNNNGSAPPTGWVEPETLNAADGGRVWVRYLVQYAGINMYNYAISGATCSNELTPRRVTPTLNFPSVKDYQIPAFYADSKYIEPNGTKFETLPTDETVYTMWIGTNDLGVNCFLTDSQAPGTTLANYVSCVFNQLHKLYANGARYFVILNIAPLNKTPLYGMPGKGGVSNTGYWPGKENLNSTEISQRMLEQVSLVNYAYDVTVPFEVVVKDMYPGAKFALYDVHSLFNDIINHPKNFLNGTSPLNTTGCFTDCTASNCVQNPDRDSFVWYDELHPSEQVERLVAQNFLSVVNGTSKYATYWSS